MKKSLTIFLQAAVALIGIVALAFMLWEPHLEGRNVNATNFEIYFKDPFLAYAYTASIAFFTELCQAFKLLGYIGRNETFSQHSARALRIIKYCAITLIVFIMGAEAYLFIIQSSKDDIAGGVMMGLAMIFVSAIVAAAAAAFERTLQNVIEMKSKNNLV